MTETISKSVVSDCQTAISIRGKWVKVPSLNVNGQTIIVTGKWIKIASLHDEDWIVDPLRSEEYTSELQSLTNIVCRLLLVKISLRPTRSPPCPATSIWGPLRGISENV